MCMVMGHNRPESVAPKDTRIPVTLPSESHQLLVEYWARLTGRSKGSLVSFLIEKAIADSLRNGEVPQQAINQMNMFIDGLAVFHSEDLNLVKEHVKTHAHFNNFSEGE